MFNGAKSNGKKFCRVAPFLSTCFNKTERTKWQEQWGKNAFIGSEWKLWRRAYYKRNEIKVWLKNQISWPIIMCRVLAPRFPHPSTSTQMANIGSNRVFHVDKLPRGSHVIAMSSVMSCSDGIVLAAAPFNHAKVCMQRFFQLSKV